MVQNGHPDRRSTLCRGRLRGLLESPVDSVGKMIQYGHLMWALRLPRGRCWLVRRRQTFPAAYGAQSREVQWHSGDLWLSFAADVSLRRHPLR